MLNDVNDKVYVGQTWTPLKTRWGVDGSGYRNSTHLYNAIKAYGEDAFHYQVLFAVNTQEAANYWEEYFTELYDARNSDVGYNIREAGSNGRHSQATKDKISKIHKGRVHSEEHNRKKSEALKGRRPSDATIAASIVANTGNTYRLGQTVSEETRAKLSEINTGKVMPQETKDKISAANKGQKRTPEQVAKSAASRTGLKRTPEQCERISDGLKGKKQSLKAIENKTKTMREKEALRQQTPQVQEQNKIITTMYIEGAKYADIMAAADCSEKHVTNVVKRAGIPLRGSEKPLGKELDEKVAHMYCIEMLTANDIAKIISHPPHIVRRSLTKQGIQLRKGGFKPGHNKYTLE